MINPWIDLSRIPPFVLPVDKPFIDFYNKKAKNEFLIHLDLRAEPYIGNINAPIVLLNQNPSFSLDDYSFYENKQVIKLWQKNLFHEDLEYPFFFLDPNIAHLKGGPEWWQKRMKMMIDEFGLENVGKYVLCVEYFGYHSRKLNIPLLRRVPSQKYGFYLVEESIKRRALIILIRGESYWKKSVPSLLNYPNLFKLNSWQNACITRNNCPKGYEAISKILQFPL